MGLGTWQPWVHGAEEVRLRSALLVRAERAWGSKAGPR